MSDTHFKDYKSAAEALTHARKTGEPIVGDDKPKEPRVIEPDPETGLVKYPEPRWKSVDEAYDELKEEAEHARAREEHDEAENKKVESREQLKAVVGASTWNKDEREFLNKLEVRTNAYHANTEALLREEARLPELERTNPVEGAALRQRLMVAAERLQEERRALTSTAHIVKESAETKTRTSGLKELFDMVPELESEEARDQLLKWAVKKRLGTERQLRDVRDPASIARAWDQMQKEKGEAKRDKSLRKIAGKALALSGPGSAGSSKEAMAALKKSGSVRDAENLLNMRRLEKQHGI